MKLCNTIGLVNLLNNDKRISILLEMSPCLYVTYDDAISLLVTYT